MARMLTLIQAQERYISRINSCHTGHIRRVRRGARRELRDWLIQNGHTDEASISQLIKDAQDMAELESLADDA